MGQQDQSGLGGSLLERAYALQNETEAKDLYDEWAASYDKDLSDQAYLSPQRSVEATIANLPLNASNLKILDAGCGTGLVGACLDASKLKGSYVIDGLDLTPGMLAVARQKGIYQDLEEADLGEPIKREDRRYDVILCVGTLTKGHVGPKVFGEFARVTSKGGLIVATVHDEIFESGGYKAEVERLQSGGVIDILSTDDFGITEGREKGGRMVVLRKQ